MISAKEFFPLLVILISSSNFGMLTSFPGPAASSIKKLYPDLKKYKVEWSWFSDGPRLSAAFGCFFFYPIVYRFGRKISISIGAFLNGLFYFLLLPANDNLMIYLVVIRIIQGLLWGFMSTITLVYLLEMSPPNCFGFTGCMHQFFNVSGIVLNNILAAFVDFRTLAIVDGIISLVFSGLVFIIKDSPVSQKDRIRRLVKKSNKLQKKFDQNNNNNQSNNFIDSNQSNNDNDNDNNNDITSNNDNDDKTNKTQMKNNNSNNNNNYSKKNKKNNNNNNNNTMLMVGNTSQNDKLFSKKYATTIIYSILLFYFQQFSGANAILSNLAQIMTKSGLTLDANLQSCMANCAQLVAVAIASMLVDDFGVRVLWCLSASLLVVFLLLYGLSLLVSMPHYMPVLCIFLYRLSFGLGVGPLTYCVWVQLYGDSVRYIGTAVMMSAHWLVSYVVVITFPMLKENIGEFFTVVIYAANTLIGVFFGAFCVPTKNEKDMEEMALI